MVFNKNISNINQHGGTFNPKGYLLYRWSKMHSREKGLYSTLSEKGKKLIKQQRQMKIFC